MNEHASDMELERFLRRRDRISQDYAALGSEGPPAELDALVLERARRAVEEDTSHPFWRRANWPRITALAATVVLSFALVVRLAIDNEMSAPQVVSTDSAVPPNADVRYGTPAESTAAATEAYAPPLREKAAAHASPRENISSLSMEPVQAPAADAARMSPAEQPVPMQAPAPSTESAAVAGSVRALSKQETDSALADEARLRLERRDAALAKRAAEGQPEPRTFGVEERAAAASEQEVHAQAAGEADTSQTYVVTGNRVSRVTAQDARRDPQEWYEEIESLRAKGLTEEADREMERLRAAHPDFEPAKEPAPAR